MTEAEWLACGDLDPMLLLVREKASDRKLRLFAVGCCRRVKNAISRKGHRKAIVVSERFADGLADLEECAVLAEKLDNDDTEPGMGHLLEETGFGAAYWSIRACDHLVRLLPECEGIDDLDDREREAQSRLLRCTCGNPFRPVALDPRWLSETVVALAAGIYAERAFDRMPILADALEDAGCDHADILTHCRGDGPHVRGCWVVDLILGKE